MASTTGRLASDDSLVVFRPDSVSSVHQNNNKHRYQPGLAQPAFAPSISFLSFLDQPDYTQINTISTSRSPNMRSLALLPGITTLVAAGSVLLSQHLQSCGAVHPPEGTPCSIEGQLLCDATCSNIVSFPASACVALIHPISLCSIPMGGWTVCRRRSTQC